MQTTLDTVKGKFVVIKLSGKALDSASWAADIKLLQELGARPVVVHGAGQQIDALCAALGLESKFLGGLRVTDAATLRAAEMALCSAGQQVVAALQRQGVNALGLSGRDAALLVAEPREPELGLVGRIVAVNRDALELLCVDGFVPVVSPIATGPGHAPLNTNADEAAQAVAASLGAHALLLLSDVDGVRGPDGRVARATPESIAALRASGAATGGMLPKLQACADAIAQGVGMVRILKGDASLLQALDPTQDVGTLVVPHGL
ncbi:MAG TPA: acetylglutamate kinase [Candidatus Thermoplasmatota archaeon]|jgi:acetylglutamate kinase|nr:acetylglutamate kinase [Candidatus Thermoplasmatota archaeon]